MLSFLCKDLTVKSTLVGSAGLRSTWFVVFVSLLRVINKTCGVYYNLISACFFHNIFLFGLLNTNGGGGASYAASKNFL